MEGFNDLDGRKTDDATDDDDDDDGAWVLHGKWTEAFNGVSAAAVGVFSTGRCCALLVPSISDI